MRTNRRTGGQILVDALKLHGVDTAFCVPGESYLGTLDALYDARDAIRLVVCRQEGGASNMADAYGKLTGKPGVVFVTRGPGATNASVGIHTAHQDSTPVVMFVGQVGRRMTEREAFQEIDFRRMFGQFTKWVAQIDDPTRIPEMVARAFTTATSGRPGPVVLAIPEDMQTELADAEDGARYKTAEPAPLPEQMTELRERLARAKRPLALLGGSGWSEQACADIRAWIEANDLPVAAGFRRQDLYDNRAPNYAGVVSIGVNPKLSQRIKDSDLLIVIGQQLNETITDGYTLLPIPKPPQPLVHVLPAAEDLGRVYQSDLPINAGMRAFASAARALPAVDGSAWSAWRKAANEDHRAFMTPPPMPGAVDLGAIIAALSKSLPDDAMIVNGAGNYTVWVHRFFQYKRYGTQLAPMSGAMGYGVPAAVAAKLVHPERLVVSFNGDGCFLMNGQELATAVQYQLPIVFIVVNNATYGTIRMHQERRYPGRVIGTDLRNPDFAALARAYGANGELVERTADFAPAFERARKAAGPSLIELRVDSEALTPTATVGSLRKAAKTDAR
jgi:acetolactate synthase I/II/III large subunit